MKMKKLLAIFFTLALVVLVIQGCTTSNTDTAATEPAAETETATPAETDAGNTELVLTLDELAQYDGQNGNPAYIAVDGVIYDVTNVPQWNGGGHNGYTAGNDLTEEIKTVSPHGVSKLSGLTVVGKLAE